MALALGATGIVALALFWELAAPSMRPFAARWRERTGHRRDGRARASELAYDPGRERRAEQRARALLRSCVNEEEWAMYRDLGFLRVPGGHGQGSHAEYAYLVYPHKPIVAYMPRTGAILNEYCVMFNREDAVHGGPRLPDADDVLAKWMLLTADERRLLEQANMHMPGRQIDPEQLRADLARLADWDRARAGESRAGAAPSETRHVSTITPRRNIAAGALTSRVVRP